MKSTWWIGLLAVCFPLGVHAERQKITLDGIWQFQVDPARVGERQNWQAPGRKLSRQITVPGCWQAERIGESSGELRHDYLGQGWYKRTVEVPKDWIGKQVWLKISGASRSITAFVNGSEAGRHDGFSAPFRIDVTQWLQPGQQNTVALLVDNTAASLRQLPLSEHDYSRPVGAFNYMGNWGGIYGHAELEATGPVWVREVFIRTRIVPPKATFDLTLEAGKAFEGRALSVRIRIHPRGNVGPVFSSASHQTLERGSTHAFQVELPLHAAQLWSPEHPALYVAEIAVLDGQRVLDSIEQFFGVREFRTAGGKILLNGRPYYLVGFGDLSSEVITGTPSVSLEENRRRVRMAKAFGFNYVRFHSRVPPEEFFEAADELGLLVQSELPVFYSNYLLPHLNFVWNEMDEAFPAFRNHPSFFSSALGNELYPLPGKEKEFFAAFTEFYRRSKQLNPDALAMGTDGFPYPPADFFSVSQGYVPGQPTIAHEFGGWMCSLPDLSLARRFTGVVDPYWMRATEDWLKQNHLLEVYPALLKASQRMLAEMRKFRIEKIRRMPWISGYQLWLINDYPSGTPEGYIWEEGTLNFFWEPKAAAAEDFARFNSPNVLLIDLDFSQRTWWENTTTHVKFSSSYYGPEPIDNPQLVYSLEEGGNTIWRGSTQHVHVSQGAVAEIADVAVTVPPLGRAAQCTLRAELHAGQNTVARNEWTFWVYPRERLSASKVRVVSRLSEEHIRDLYPFIQSGEAASPGDLVLANMLDPADLEQVLAGASAIIFLQPNRHWGNATFDFFPIFTGRPHAYGSRVEPHPLFRAFPNESYFDAQFYPLVEGSMALPVGGLMNPIPEKIQPLLWCVWSSGDAPPALQRSAFLYEFRAGRGKVLVSSLNLLNHLDGGYPSALYLLDQLMRYVMSPEFQPASELSEQEFAQLLIGVRG